MFNYNRSLCFADIVESLKLETIRDLKFNKDFPTNDNQWREGTLEGIHQWRESSDRIVTVKNKDKTKICFTTHSPKSRDLRLMVLGGKVRLYFNKINSEGKGIGGVRGLFVNGEEIFYDPPHVPLFFPIDSEWKEETITKVRTEFGGWTLGFGFTWFNCSEKFLVTPKEGDVVRLYGKGFGYSVRGLYINSDDKWYKVFYRTKTEQEAYHKQQVAFWAAFETLPIAFQKRIEKFGNNNPKFCRKYEMFCCEQAAVIAEALDPCQIKGPFPESLSWDEEKFDKILQVLFNEFAKMDFEKQRKRVPKLDKNHNKETLSVACDLARWYLKGDNSEVEALRGCV